MILIFFFKKKNDTVSESYKMKILPSHCKHGMKDSIEFKWVLLKHVLGLSYDTTHIPTPITVG